MDAGTELREDRREAEAGTSAFAYNDDDDEAFRFFLHELFPEVSTPHVHHYFNSNFNATNHGFLI